MQVLAMSAACAQDAARAPAGGVGVVAVTGTVLGEPGCPGPERIGSPCPPRLMGSVAVEAMRGTSVAASVTTGPDGRFTLRLIPGAYQLIATSAGPLRSTASALVTVGTSPVSVNLTVDTGIR
jgi:hypothetical protein